MSKVKAPILRIVQTGYHSAEKQVFIGEDDISRLVRHCEVRLDASQTTEVHLVLVPEEFTVELTDVELNLYQGDWQTQRIEDEQT